LEHESDDNLIKLLILELQNYVTGGVVVFSIFHKMRTMLTRIIYCASVLPIRNG
jgi:hypothetical protein